jgi:L-fuconolactonase
MCAMQRRTDVEGRDEIIVDPNLPIIDAHHHLFDRPGLRYLLEEYLADTSAGHNIIASVYVETLAFARTDGPEVLRPLGEVEFATGVAAMSASGVYGSCRVGAAMVGYADLRAGDSVAQLLDCALQIAPERFRGIRQISMQHPSEAPYRYITHRPPAGILQSPGFRLAFRHLAPRGLSFDAAVFHHQLPAIADLADAFPDTTIVLNHLGMAMAMDMNEQERAAVFRDWRDLVLELAHRPNVMCKIGGLGLPFWGFGFETRAEAVGYLDLVSAWRPYVMTAIEAFGPHRCMMESNFPPDRRSCGFVPLWNALKRIAESFSDTEKAALFHGTAARVYRLHLPASRKTPG